MKRLKIKREEYEEVILPKDMWDLMLRAMIKSGDKSLENFVKLILIARMEK